MFAVFEDEPPEPLVAVSYVVLCCPNFGDPQVALVRRDGGWRVPGVPVPAGRSAARAAADLVAAMTGVSCRSCPGEPGWLEVSRPQAVLAGEGVTANGVRAVMLGFGLAVPETLPLAESRATWVSLRALADHPETLEVVTEIVRSL